MADTINGRTPEEIKKELVEAIEEASWVVEGGDAHDLIDAVEKAHASMADALALIQQLERERDAAVEQLKQADKENLLECTHCKHNVRCSEILLGCNDCDNSECPCSTCVDLSNWQWRGVQEVE